MQHPAVHTHNGVSQDPEDWQLIRVHRVQANMVSDGVLALYRHGHFWRVVGISPDGNTGKYRVSLEGDRYEYILDPMSDSSLYVSSVPIVGMGATECLGSDRYPYTVIKVTDRDHVTVQRDDFVRTDSNGLSESQEYEYTPNPLGRTYDVYYSVKAGCWKVRKYPDIVFHVGSRRAYLDPSY